MASLRLSRAAKILKIVVVVVAFIVAVVVAHGRKKESRSVKDDKFTGIDEVNDDDDDDDEDDDERTALKPCPAGDEWLCNK